VSHLVQKKICAKHQGRLSSGHLLEPGMPSLLSCTYSSVSWDFICFPMCLCELLQDRFLLKVSRAFLGILG